MNKKLYWGLGVLFILIIGGFVFLLVQQKAELAKYEADYALPTEKVAENENNKKTPQNGHWHGDEWHDEPHEPIVDVADETSQQSEVVRPNFPVAGEVEFSQLPELPTDIDPSVLKWSEGFLTFISNQYPDLVEAHQLFHESNEKFKKRFSTEADMERLRERGAEMEKEFLRQRREMFRQFPKEKYELILSQLYTEYTKMLGEEAAAAAIAGIRADVGY